MIFRRCFVLLLFSCLVAAPAATTVWAGDAAPAIGDIGAHRPNAEAIEALRTMTPEEIATLDAYLERALVLYYDREFTLALPIFRDLAEKVETMDILFWLGTSAAAVGQTDLAIEKFRKMLAIDPSLYRVRLELASAYFATRRYAEARTELETVLAAEPPPEVAANIRRMLGAIDERTRKASWSLRLATGVMWDDNISSGPDAGLYTFSNGATFRPTATAAKLSDTASVTNFTGNFLYDPGEKQGWMWNTAATGYLKAYSEYSEFDYQVIDLQTGPWWATANSVLKVPVGVTHSEFASDRLSTTLHADPSYEFFFSPTLSLRGTWRLRSEAYADDTRAGNFDNTAQVIELSPTLYLGDRRHMITATVAHEFYDAENDANAYRAPMAGLSYLARFPTRTEIYLGVQWARRSYDGLQAFPYAGQERDDTRQSATAALSQVFLGRFNLSYAFAYTENRSNLDLNTWDKTTHTVSVGCQF